MFLFFNLTFRYLYVACILIILSLDGHTEFLCLLFLSLTPDTFAEDREQPAQVVITTWI